MSPKFLTALTVAGILAAGLSIYAEPPTPPAPNDQPPPPIKEKEGKDSVKPGPEGAKFREGREGRRGMEMGPGISPQIGEYIMKEKYPNEAKEIENLRKMDPAKAREAMDNLRKKAGEAFRAEQEEIKTLADNYRTSNSAQDLDKLKDKIQKRLNEKLEMEQKIIEKSDEQIKLQQEKLAKFKEEHEKRMNNKDKMIEQKIKELSEPPELKF